MNNAKQIITQIAECQEYLLELGFTHVNDDLFSMTRTLAGNAPLVITFKTNCIEFEISRMLCVEKRSKIQYTDNWFEVVKNKISTLAKNYANQPQDHTANWFIR